jgi:hypothetical protein
VYHLGSVPAAARAASAPRAALCADVADVAEVGRTAGFTWPTEPTANPVMSSKTWVVTALHGNK